MTPESLRGHPGVKNAYEKKKLKDVNPFVYVKSKFYSF